VQLTTLPLRQTASLTSSKHVSVEQRAGGANGPPRPTTDSIPRPHAHHEKPAVAAAECCDLPVTPELRLGAMPRNVDVDFHYLLTVLEYTVPEKRY